MAVHSVQQNALTKKAKQWLPPIWAALAGIALWYAITAVWRIPPYLVPRPHGIVQAAVTRWSSLSVQGWHTWISALTGFMLSAVIGVAVAITLNQWSPLRRSLYPYTAALQTVPIVAVAPIIIVWLGSGKPAIIAISFIVSVFPVITNTLLGLMSAEPNLHDLMDLYNASPTQKLVKLQLPQALPSMMVGFRISGGMAIIGAILGEFVAGVGGLQGGLGYVITVAAKTMDMEYLFAAVVASVLMGMATLWGVDRVSRVLLRHWDDVG